MSIKKITEGASGTRYRVRYREPDSNNPRCATFKKKADAQRFERDIKTAKDRGQYVSPSLGKITLREWWELYQKKPTWIRLTLSTKQSYEGLWRIHIEPHMGGRQLASIRRGDVEDWVGTLMRGGVSDARTNGAHRVLRRVLQTAVNDGRIVANPASRIEGVPAVPEAQERPLTPEEIERIADVVPPRYRALVLFLAWSGCRIGEAAGLRVRNLDLLRGEVIVSEALVLVKGEFVVGKTKNKAKRTVALPAFLVEELRRHLEMFPAGVDDYVFRGERGAPLNRSNFRARVWMKALEAADIKKPWPRVHDSRHTMVSIAIAIGEPAKVVQARAGHKTSAMTDRYTHLYEGQDRALAKRFDELRADACHGRVTVGENDVASIETHRRKRASDQDFQSIKGR